MCVYRHTYIYKIELPCCIHLKLNIVNRYTSIYLKVVKNLFLMSSSLIVRKKSVRTLLA